MWQVSTSNTRPRPALFLSAQVIRETRAAPEAHEVSRDRSDADWSEASVPATKERVQEGAGI